MALPTARPGVAGPAGMMVALARFTPSVLDHDTLEQLFVSREHLLVDAVSRIGRAASGAERGHKLFVGPRGAGKTHLLSLTYHRARQLPGYGTAFQLAWLPEDPWTISSLDDLLVEVLGHLEPSAFDMTTGDGAEGDIVRAAARGGPIVVLLENFEQIAAAIGREGQHRLRALLENDRPMLLIATATRITEHLMSQAEPFYGFFDTTTLQPFDLDEATEMLQAIARLNDDLPLEHRLGERSARSRLSAVEHLAGGQPRVWALLAAGLSIARLDDLVATLIERFDDLTPYYQQQLAGLSPNERRVVKALAASDRAMTVSELAEAARIEQRSLSKTITLLRRRGWVRARTGLLVDQGDRRLSYYELAEPLARVAFQLKESRGQPIKLVLDFLTAWFDQSDLAGAAGGTSASQAYLHAASEAARFDPVLLVCHRLGDTTLIGTLAPAAMYAPRPQADNPNLAVTLASLDDALAAYQDGDPVPLLQQPVQLSRLVEDQLLLISPVTLRLKLAQLALRSDLPDVSNWTVRVEDVLDQATADERLTALFLLGHLHLEAGDEVAAGVVFHQATEAIVDVPGSGTAAIMISASKELIRAGFPAWAIQLLRPARGMADAEQRFDLAAAMQDAYSRTGQLDAAVREWSDVVQLLTTSLGAEHQLTLSARYPMAAVLRHAGQTERARSEFRRLLDDGTPVLGAEHQVILATRGGLALCLGDTGQFEAAIAEDRRLIDDCTRLLGADHIGTLTIRNNLGTWLGRAGRTAEAVAKFRRLLDDSARVLGANDTSTLTTRNNLAWWLGDDGQIDLAVTEFRRLLDDRTRVLGADHPDVIITRDNLDFWVASGQAASGEREPQLPTGARTTAARLPS